MSEEITMESWLAAEENNEGLQVNDIVTATVEAVSDNEATVHIDGHKNDIPVPKKELQYPEPDKASDVVKVGDKIDVVVVSLGGEYGATVSKTKAARMSAWKDLEEENIVEKAEPIDAEVTQVVKGGLVAIVRGVRAFIPASQVELHFVKDLNAYVGQTVQALPIELDARKQRLVLSRRQILQAEREKRQAEVFEKVQAGDIVMGTVKRLVDYGAFIDIGGVDGLAHISDLSWKRVSKPSDVLTEGQELDVKVKSIDPETKRISLSVKETLPDPWVENAKKYEEGSIISGKIIKLTKFGAFMEIEPGFDGLIPMGELADRHINSADEAVRQGDEVSVKILRIDMDRKRISLSITKAAKEAE